MRARNVVLTSSALLLCATFAHAAANERRVQRVVDMKADGRLSIDTHNGSITVTTWNQPRVKIQARIEPGDPDHPEDVQKTEVRISGSGSSVRVETDYSAVKFHQSGWFGQTRSRPPVHYTISMPATASLDIDDHNATVRVTGLRGDLNIDAHNGDIAVSDHAGGVTIDAHNARVRVAFAQFTRSVSIETHNGPVEIRLPSSAKFHVDANGHRLGVDSDFPVVTRRMNKGTYIGDVNGGGPELRFSTHNGTLRLKRS